MRTLVIEKALIKQNIAVIKEKARGAVIYGMLSGDGGGVGTVPLAQLLRDEGITHFAVHEVEEARALREAGFVEEEILMLRSTTDRELLEQVWQNLLRNAIKFTPEGGSIRVGLTTQEGAFRVQIADTGIGIDESAQKHIFEKFFQADTSHHTEGSGLGLSLVKRIVDACGGEITVESQLGKGSTFSVTLPARPRG